MDFSDKELQHLAKLAALSLSDEEAHSLRQELSEILNYVELLSDAPTKGVEPTSHLHANTNSTRDDSNKESFSQDAVKSIASEFAHGGFRVPKVL